MCRYCLVVVGWLALCAFGNAEPKRYALLIGINKYEHAKLNALQYAVNDATELRDLLKATGYQTVLLTNDTDVKPIGEAIVKSVAELLRNAKAGDTVLIAFAGHGLQFEGDKDSYFCPLDARPFKDEKKTLVSMSAIYGQMERSFAGVKILLVDACRDDPDTGRGSRGIDADSAPRPPLGVAAFFSCSASQRAYEHPDLKHGIFFHHVLKGLRGAAENSEHEVTFNSLVDYVGKNVERDVPRLIGGGAEQQPNQKADLKGRSPVLRGNGKTLNAARGQKEFQEASSYRTGIGRNFDRRQEVDWAKRAAELGHSVAMVWYAEALRLGDVVPKDEDLAEKLEKDALPEIRKAAALNDSVAQNCLGLMYDSGRGVEKDEKEAVNWYRKAASQEYALAQHNLGRSYADGTGVEQDEKEAVNWYRKAAAQNYAKAQHSLGFMYEKGRGVEQDEKEAVNWYRKAAQQNYPDAHNNLGLMYKTGTGVEKDEREAVTWFRKAAAQNYAAGQHNLGLMYDVGLGVEQDDKEAVKWYRKAVAQNYALAQYNLGVLYLEGRGVEQDDKEAARLYRKAAAQKDAWAQYGMGYMYEQGRGVPRDIDHAVEWYRKAAAQNFAKAQEALKRLRR